MPEIASVRSFLPLGSLSTMSVDPTGFYSKLFEEQGDWVRFRFGPMSILLISDPEAAQELLRRDADGTFIKGRANNVLAPLLGEGMFLTEGERWARQRRTAQPHFTVSALPDLIQTSWDGAAALCEPGEHAVYPVMRRVVVGAASRVLLGSAVWDERADLREQLNALWLVNDDLQDPKKWLRPGLWRQRKKLLETTRVHIDKAIADQRRRPDETTLLGRLVTAVDPKTHRPFGEKELRDEAMTLILTGQECSAISTAWTLLLLAHHPDAQQRVFDEVSGVSPVATELRACATLRASIDESNRLYPPAWLLAREAATDTELAGVPLTKGQVVFVCPRVVHRHPQYWSAPDAFQPERWAKLNKRSRRAYFPFGVGPRVCLGMRLALTISQAIVARIIREVHLEPTGPLVMHPTTTLRPDDGCAVRVVRR